jgi:hypothetical protein
MFSRFSIFEVPSTTDLFALQDIANYNGNIVSYNVSTGCYFSTPVTKLYRNIEKVSLWRIRLYNKCFLYCTEDSKIMDSSGNFRKISELKQFDEVMCVDMVNNKIAEITNKDGVGIHDYAYVLKTESGNAVLNNFIVYTGED